MEQVETNKNATVLIVEDDNSIAYLLKFIMEREGFSVAHAPDGKVALSMVETLPPPDLVLLDIMLPYADGYEILESIRRQPNWKDTPVLMLTSKGTERDISHALDSGADDYLLKPFQPDELKARIRRLLRGRR